MNPASKQCNRCGRILPSPATRDQIHEIRDRFTHRPNHVIWIVLDALTRAEKDADECHAMHRAETRRAEQAEQRVRELEAEIIKQKDVSNALGDALAVLPTTPKQMMERVRVLEAALREVFESVPATYDEQDPMVRRHAAALNAIPAALARPTPAPEGEQG